MTESALVFSFGFFEILRAIFLVASIKIPEMMMKIPVWSGSGSGRKETKIMMKEALANQMNVRFGERNSKRKKRRVKKTQSQLKCEVEGVKMVEKQSFKSVIKDPLFLNKGMPTA